MGIAGQSELESARERITFHGSDQRFGGWRLGHAGETAPLQLRPLAAHEGFQIHPGTEMAAGAGDDPHPQLGLRIQPVQRRRDCRAKPHG